MKTKLAVLSALIFSASAIADSYKLDTEGMHSSINFKVPHLGYGFVAGRFNDFSGGFDYDSTTGEVTNVKVVVKTKSVDSNQGDRDKHLRSDDFLDASAFPEATFVSTGYSQGQLTGELSIRGIKKPVTIELQKTDEGKDPWGGYRVGFIGQTSLTLADFGMTKDLGPSSKVVEVELLVEGVKQ